MDRIGDVWIALGAALALTQLALLATSVYLHRALAHRSLHVNPAADVVFRTVLWLTTGQSRQAWVAVHRKHHAFTDREGDPHSPRLLGFWRVQLLNVVYYVREARNPDTIEKFAPDLPLDRLDRTVFSRGVVGLSSGIVLLCAVLGVVPGLAAAAAEVPRDLQLEPRRVLHGADGGVEAPHPGRRRGRRAGRAHARADRAGGRRARSRAGGRTAPVLP